MRWLIAFLILLLLALQVRLWIGQGSLAEIARLEREIDEQQAINQRVEERNQRLRNEVEALKHGHESIEERARQDLGMIRDGETFYFVVKQGESR